MANDGKLDFGPWEQIFYGELDGSRPKRALTKIIGVSSAHAGTCRIGRRISNIVPRPGSLSTWISPWCFATTA